MSIHWSFFNKNNTLIKNGLTNNSQNPVTEISYGTFDKQVSRFIFDVDLSNLKDKIDNGFINPNRIVKHTLHLTNTIKNADQYIGKKSYSLNIDRATSFKLDVFNIDEDWDEGGGYDIIFNNVVDLNNTQPQASNWFDRKIAIPWNTEGYYQTGTTQIIGSQDFENGSENIEIDVTDYINQRLFSGGTGTTGTTGTSYGMGIKFSEVYEELETEFRQAVAFHTRHTHTFYEPHIETIIDDNILDDRNYFYLDKDNDIYLYVNIGGINQNIVVNSVDIYDYEDNLYATLTGASIIEVSKGIYKITLNIDSRVYPDSVLFRDVWNLNINGRDVEFEDMFYLISPENYYLINKNDNIDFNNYYFNFHGINENENISAGGIRKIKLNVRELYPNQNNFVPLYVEYRLFTMINGDTELDVIPFTSVNRINSGYEFNLDTSWLIPQDYKIEIRMFNGNYYKNMKRLSFTITSTGNILKR